MSTITAEVIAKAQGRPNRRSAGTSDSTLAIRPQASTTDSTPAVPTSAPRQAPPVAMMPASRKVRIGSELANSSEENDGPAAQRPGRLPTVLPVSKLAGRESGE